jgi:hypothetical protein
VKLLMNEITPYAPPATGAAIVLAGSGSLITGASARKRPAFCSASLPISLGVWPPQPCCFETHTRKTPLFLFSVRCVCPEPVLANARVSLFHKRHRHTNAVKKDTVSTPTCENSSKSCHMPS